MKFIVLFSSLFFGFVVQVSAHNFGTNDELKLRYKNGKFQTYVSRAGRQEIVLQVSDERPSPALSVALEQINFAIQNQMLKSTDKFDESSLLGLARGFAAKAATNPVYVRRLEQQYTTCDMHRLNGEAANRTLRSKSLDSN